jgi:hypothetical protein
MKIAFFLPYSEQYSEEWLKFYQQLQGCPSPKQETEVSAVEWQVA